MANLTPRPAAVKFASGKSTFIGRNTRDSFVQDEYIAEVNGSVAFATTPYAFNPGQAACFPRFSREAVLYEKWICVMAEFYFKPEVSQFATNGTTGKVMLSFDYDASDPAPGNKQQVEDTMPHADGMPWETVRLRLDADELNVTARGKYVRPGGLPGGADIKFYDGGVFYVSTVANQSAGVIGELRVRYHFMLHKPVLENSNSAPTNYRVSQFYSGVSQATVVGVPTIVLLGTVAVNGLFITNTAGVMVLPAGNYHISAQVRDTTSAVGIIEELVVNGVALPFITATIGVAANVSTSAAWFVASTGTTTVSLRATTSASATIQGNIVILSV